MLPLPLMTFTRTPITIRHGATSFLVLYLLAVTQREGALDGCVRVTMRPLALLVGPAYMLFAHRGQGGSNYMWYVAVNTITPHLKAGGNWPTMPNAQGTFASWNARIRKWVTWSLRLAIYLTSRQYIFNYRLLPYWLTQDLIELHAALTYGLFRRHLPRNIMRILMPHDFCCPITTHDIQMKTYCEQYDCGGLGVIIEARSFLCYSHVTQSIDLDKISKYWLHCEGTPRLDLPCPVR